MKKLLQGAVVLLLLSTFISQPSTAHAQGTAFTYQGRLNDGASAANGSYDLRFTLYDAATNGSMFGALTNTATGISNGLFTVTLDFGGVFNGTNYWLELAARTNGGGAFSPLSPRQPITPTPQAIYAANAGSAAAANLTGMLLLAQLPGAVVTNGGTDVTLSGVFGGTFNGFGGNLINLNASQLSFGTVADARLSANVALLNGTNQFTGTNTFVYLVGNGAGLTNLNVAQLSGSVMTNNQTGVTLSGVFGGTFNGFGANLIDLNASQLNFGTVPVAALGNAWQRGGNSGTTSGTDFIGTTDNQPLEFKVNNQRALRIEPTVYGSNYAPNTIGGWSGNHVAAGFTGAVIGGGGSVGGTNQVTGDFGTIAGGSANSAAGYGSVGGGYRNAASGPFASTVAGGEQNTASGQNATVPGGLLNTASGFLSFAAGRQAKANHQGTFVWADSTVADFASTGNDQFLVRAAGGVGIGKNNPATALDVNGTVTATTFAGTFNGFGGNLTGLNASQLSFGTVPLAQLPGAVVTNGGSGVTLSGTFAGNGAGVTNVNLQTVNSGGMITWLTNFPGNFTLSSSPAVGNVPYSVTAADVNADGKLDLICANAGGGTLSVLTNNGSGGFTQASLPVTGSSPYSVIAADVNGDGKVDLISANASDNTLTVLTNNGNGIFLPTAPTSVGSHPVSVAAADVNGDGKVDLITANANANSLTVLTNNGSGGFVIATSPNVGAGPNSVVAADVNGDGKIDLISANANVNSLTVLTNNGSGGFVISASPSVGSYPLSVTAADVNGDGKVDLISANFSGNNLSVLTNNGSGNFTLSSLPTVGVHPISVAAADVNGDGKVDLICANNTANTLSVLTNDGSGGFQILSSPVVGNGPISVLASDVSGDGKVDLICGNNWDGQLTVLFNTPNISGRFNGNGSGLSSLNASQLTTGTVPLAQLPGAVVTNGGSGVTMSGTFTGNGSGLTNLNGYVAKAGDTMTGILNLPANGLVAGGNQLVLTNGNVGIGMANPAAKLTVFNSSTQALRVGRSDAASFDIGIQTPSPDDSLIFYGNQPGYDGYIFGGVSGEKMRITSAGKVGIGTTNPASPLTVNADPPGEGLVMLQPKTALTAGPHNIIRYKNSAGTSTRYALTENGTTGVIGVTAADVNVMNFLAGNVGIGTVSPGAALDVQSGNIRAFNGNGGALEIKRTSDGWTPASIVVSQDSSYMGLVEFKQNTADTVGGVPTTTMSLYRGNVGIGTTVPGAPLDIKSLVNGPTGGLRLTAASSANTWNLHHSGANEDFGISRNNAATPYVSILASSGNVGIGTASPGAALDVQSGNIRAFNGNGGAFEFKRSSDGWTPASIVVSQDSSYMGLVEFKQNTANTVGGVPTTTMSLSRGKVGVGLAAPRDQLNVLSVASGGGSGILVGPTNPDLGLRLSYDSNNGNTKIDNLFDTTNQTTGRIDFRTRTAGTPVSAMTIQPNGNVGIGTVSPATTLDVNGAATVRGTINAVGGLIIENRTSDPVSPATGQIWLRTDL